MAATSMESFNERIMQLEMDSAFTKAELLDILRQMIEQKQSVVDDVQVAFANVRTRLELIINDTTRSSTT